MDGRKLVYSVVRSGKHQCTVYGENGVLRYATRSLAKAVHAYVDQAKHDGIQKGADDDDRDLRESDETHSLCRGYC